MATVPKYLDKELYETAEFTDTNRLTPVFIFDGQGNVLTASGYVPYETVKSAIYSITNRITPVIAINEMYPPSMP